MFRTPAFERFVAPARHRPAVRRLLFAIILGVIAYFILTIAIVGFSVYALGLWEPGQDPAMVLYLFENPNRPTLMVPVLASFIPMGLAACLMALLHRRNPITLFGTGPGFWRLFWIAVGVIVTLQAAFLVMEVAGGVELGYIPNLTIPVWLFHLLWAIPLLFIQTTSEEMIFRGYLQQQLAARFNSAFFWMLVPSVLFGFAHYNPDADPLLRWGIVGATGLFGLIAADLTRVTGNLAAAMGLHFANNFFALLVVGIPDDLSGLALFHTPFTSEDTEIITSFLWIDVALLIVIWFFTRLAVRRLHSPA